METKIIHLNHLRNEEHFFFHTEIRDLIAEFNPQTLKIQALFDKYQTLLDDLDDSMEVIRKSSITAEIVSADEKRDNVFRGLCDFVKAMSNHFDGEKVKSATRIQIVLDTYGNLAPKPFFDETASIFNLVQELRSNYAADMVKIHLTEWVEGLADLNNDFKILLGDRYEETASKTSLKVKEVRPQIDDTYRKIVKVIEGLLLLENADIYKQFIKRINLINDKYHTLLAQRKGKK